MLRVLSVAIAISSAVAFSTVQHQHHNLLGSNGRGATSTSLDATSSNSRRQLLQNTAAVAASTLFIKPTLANAAGAYQAESGYDDFSGGLTLPKYNVDNEGQLGISVPQEKEIDPAKLEKLQAKKEAAKAKALAKAEAAAKAKADAAAKEEAKIQANAAKIAAKEEQKKRQLENMSEKQRAKIEAYEAAKRDKSKGPSAVDNMKRMYGL